MPFAKEDLEISHIPVIMLTARADLDDKLEGLGLGADDYIAKPFEARELRIRVEMCWIKDSDYETDSQIIIP